MNKLIILSIVIASILYSKDDKVVVSINGLESAGLSKRYITYSQYTIQDISINLEEIEESIVIEEELIRQKLNYSNAIES